MVWVVPSLTHRRTELNLNTDVELKLYVDTEGAPTRCPYISHCHRCFRKYEEQT